MVQKGKVAPSAAKNRGKCGLVLGAGDGGPVSSVAVIGREAISEGQPGPDPGKAVHQGRGGQGACQKLGVAGFVNEAPGEAVLKLWRKAGAGLDAVLADEALKGFGDELIPTDGVKLAGGLPDPAEDLGKGHLCRWGRGRNGGAVMDGVILTARGLCGGYEAQEAIEGCCTSGRDGGVILGEWKAGFGEFEGCACLPLTGGQGGFVPGSALL